MEGLAGTGLDLVGVGSHNCRLATKTILLKDRHIEGYVQCNSFGAVKESFWAGWPHTKSDLNLGQHTQQFQPVTPWLSQGIQPLFLTVCFSTRPLMELVLTILGYITDKVFLTLRASCSYVVIWLFSRVTAPKLANNHKVIETLTHEAFPKAWRRA